MHKSTARADPPFKVAYVVKAWPRLSETFILNEIISLERRGVSIRIFSVKEPDAGPSNSAIAEVRADLTCLALRPSWRKALVANLRLLLRRPGRYLRVFAEAMTRVIYRRRLAALRHFFKAGYLADILLGQPVDHLHAHFASTPTLVAMFAHRLSGTPYTFTAHAKDIYVSDTDMLRLKMGRASAVVTCTEYNRKFLLKQFGPLAEEKVHRIYHGLDISQFCFSRSRIAESREPVILSVARLVEKKGLADLIAAAHILRQRGRSFRVEIIGVGPLWGPLKTQLQDLGLGDCVTLAGALAHDSVRLAYQQASVFVLPCVVASNGDRDGIPNVLLEAMASGVPVVSTPLSGIPELIASEVNGLLVPPHDPKNLADAIERLLDSRELRDELARAARAKLESLFSLEASAEKLLAIFKIPEGGKAVEIPAAVGVERAASLTEGS